MATESIASSSYDSSSSHTQPSATERLGLEFKIGHTLEKMQQRDPQRLVDPLEVAYMTALLHAFGMDLAASLVTSCQNTSIQACERKHLQQLVWADPVFQRVDDAAGRAEVLGAGLPQTVLKPRFEPVIQKTNTALQPKALATATKKTVVVLPVTKKPVTKKQSVPLPVQHKEEIPKRTAANPALSETDLRLQAVRERIQKMRAARL